MMNVKPRVHIFVVVINPNLNSLNNDQVVTDHSGKILFYFASKFIGIMYFFPSMHLLVPILKSI